jgi:hypothetical protein
MALLRYQLFLGLGVAFLAVWYAALSSTSTTDDDLTTLLIVYAPVWAIVFLGSYAVATIAIGLTNFRDCPEASAEIEEQVKEAKAEMKKRGVIKE